MEHVGTLADDEGPPHTKKMHNKCHICETNKQDFVCTGCFGDYSAPGAKHPPTKVCTVSCGVIGCNVSHAQRAFGAAAVHELQKHPCSRCGGWCCCSWNEVGWNSPERLALPGGYVVNPVQCMSGIECKFEHCGWRLMVKDCGKKEERREAFVAHLDKKHRSAPAPAPGTAETNDVEMEDDPIADGGGALSLTVREATMDGFEGDGAGCFSNMAGFGEFDCTPDELEWAKRFLENAPPLPGPPMPKMAVQAAAPPGTGEAGATNHSLSDVSQGGGSGGDGALEEENEFFSAASNAQFPPAEPSLIKVHLSCSSKGGTEQANKIFTFLNLRFEECAGFKIAHEPLIEDSYVEIICRFFAFEEDKRILRMFLAKYEKEGWRGELTSSGVHAEYAITGSLIIGGRITWEGLKRMLAERERHRNMPSSSKLGGEDEDGPLDGAAAFYRHLDGIKMAFVKPAKRVCRVAAKMTIEQYTVLASKVKAGEGHFQVEGEAVELVFASIDPQEVTFAEIIEQPTKFSAFSPSYVDIFNEWQLVESIEPEPLTASMLQQIGTKNSPSLAWAAMAVCTKRSDGLELARLLISEDAEFNTGKALLLAAKAVCDGNVEGALELARILIEKGSEKADIDHNYGGPSPFYRGPLWWAARAVYHGREGGLALAQLLVEKGA
eukprot:CAMPEP_0181352762 /NCGR_PEP_ID=MMETSP1106-20121128/2483_1 /TAXON_ID=81844 /ORGANISM="Mantoniella antarctica, Strain SL-175" /LENGTH=664 /DNA_ID=CAMNT_0023465345 /DNA_START=6 /DNA_END=1996 /DNA_ORIENTATION=-